MEETAFRRPCTEDEVFEFVDFAPLLRCLAADSLLSLVTALLAERRIVFVSSNLEQLSACVNALLALVRPLQWEYVFIPILPVDQITFCCSPTPFVVGVLASAFEVSRESGSRRELLMFLYCRCSSRGEHTLSLRTLDSHNLPFPNKCRRFVSSPSVSLSSSTLTPMNSSRTSTMTLPCCRQRHVLRTYLACP